ncbi:MAG: hypothetical protein K9K76_11170 [Halanaerobiales bacterium]|nr:hypothetical protein [Halanaerobiales bacterium]
MNRKIILFLIFVLMFSLSLTIYAQEEVINENLNNSIFYSPDYNSIDINDYIIRLPEKDMVLKDFGSQYQNRLKELADRYGDNQTNLLDIVFDDEINGENRNNDNIINEIASNVNVNLGYDQLNNKDSAAVELNYDVDSRTSVRAGYEFHNVNNTYDTNFDIENNYINNNIILDENNVDSRLGISYQTTDKIKIFADYVYNDILEKSGESTVFGLQYNNRDSQISAEYSIINELEKQGRATGLSYQYEDLANFSASYKLLNFDVINERLREEKTWDFGVDFNLNEDSSFSIGLQVINAEVIQENKDNDDEPKEDSSNTQENIDTSNEESTSVEASFKIKF